VRALVRRELPNLRRAFDALRAQEEHEQAVEMATHIAWFLKFFSLGRELADLRGKQEAAAALAASEEGTLVPPVAAEDGQDDIPDVPRMDDIGLSRWLGNKLRGTWHWLEKRHIWLRWSGTHW
jgi:hypothetical protein